MSLPTHFIHLLKTVSENHTDKAVFHINEVSYSYSKFYQKVNEISAELNTTAIQKKVIVNTHNDLETYASIIAIWLTGNTYVPLNCNESNERLKQVLKIINADKVLSSKEIENNCFDDLDVLNTSVLTPTSIPIPTKQLNNKAIAYILFTSGTTGIPKGVPISYQNLDAFVDSFLSLDYSFSSNDNFLQMADLTFDMSIISTLIPLCIGAAITTINDDEIKYLATYKTLSEQNITILVTAPSTLQLLEPYYSEIHLKQLKYTFVGAEAFYESTAQQWQTCAPNTKIINLYGPSEGGILATNYNWKKDNSSEYQGIVAIGKPVKNIDLYIVDETENIINDDQEGEAWVSGKQVFDSYLNENSNADSFAYLTLNEEKVKCFKTGDIVFRNNEGDLFYCGRKDNQIKVQGKRIELGEIEYYANQLNSNFKAVAISYKGDFGSTQIALFIDKNINRKELDDYLKAHLPVYMLPAKIIGLAELPLNKNQKIDKKALERFIDPEKSLSTHQQIIFNFYALFKYLFQNSTSEYKTNADFNTVITPNSTWPNFTFNLKLKPEIAKSQLNELINLINKKQTPNYIILDEEQINQHENVLTKLGFVPLAKWACLAFEKEIPYTILNNKLEIKKITTEEDLNKWVKVASSGFGELDFSLFQNCLTKKEIIFYAGYYQSKMVATAMLFFNNDTAGIYHVVTLPAARNKGFGSQLFRHCQKEAIQNGAKKIITQSTEQGLNAWKGIGMKQYGNFYLFCWNKPKS
jgi:D-alanine--poly(phosphoribitol) ligase subunit 1